MLHYEALQQLCHDRGQHLRHDGAAERLALQARMRQHHRRRRLALRDTLDLLRRHRAARHNGLPA